MQGRNLVKPRLTEIYLLNDDVTPIDMVAFALTGILGKGEYETAQILEEAQEKDEALAGTYLSNVAEGLVGELAAVAPTLQVRTVDVPYSFVNKDEEDE